LGHPFGSHASSYTSGTIAPTGSRASLDAATAAFYDSWKAALLVNGCGGYYVNFGGRAKEPILVSEGHGYGMLITVMMAGHDPDARAIFDGFYDVFRKFPSINNADLMAWAVLRNCVLSTSATDLADSATDGDLDIAFALLLADKQWGSCGRVNYLAEAQKVVAAIKAHDLNHTTNLALLGDWADTTAPYYAARYASFTGPYGAGSHKDYYWGTRPSDFMMDHFKAYGAASGDADWTKVIDAHYGLVAAIAPPATGLVPDFVDKTNTAPAPAGANYLEDVTDGDYAYNACRVPWRVGTDYLVSGEARAKAVLDKINAWIVTKTGGDPTKILDGYKLDGTTIGGGPSFAFEAPFAVAAMAGPSSQKWLDAIWTHMVVQTPTASVGYYEDTLKLLAMIVLSANWWQP